MRRPRSRKGKEGIALVIVLGFLAVLLTLGVAFAISMRTERLAARNYVDNVKAHQLMQVAVARSLSSISADLNAQANPEYPAWTNYYSTDSGSCTDLLSGVACGYVPKSLQRSASNAAPSVEWASIRNNDNKLIGRYGFLAVNCSGLLDANCIGGLPHTYGTNAAEISDSTVVIAEISDSGNFRLSRTQNKRFESLPELYWLGRSAPVFMNPASYPDSLFVYSYFASNQWLDTVDVLHAPLFIGGDEASVMNARPQIEAEFTAMGVMPADAAIAARNVVDYLDANNEPGNGIGVENFCTEPVPMINEIVITNTIGAYNDGAGNDVYINRLDIMVELWYPFVGYSNPNDYTVELIVLSSGPTPQFCPMRPPPAAKAVVLKPWPGGGGRYRIVPMPPVIATYSTPSASPSVPSLPTQVGFDLKVREGNNNPNGVIVDAIRPQSTVIQWNSALVAAVPAVGSTNNTPVYRKEADDPRINWDWVTQWRDRSAASDSLGQQNSALTYSSSAETNMYVRNYADLRVVGELGMLLYGNTPWRTIRLLDPGALPILDRFTASTNAFRKGLVNPNTLNSNVLAAVFYDVVPEGWPGEGGPGLTAEEALAAATNMICFRPYVNVSDIARMTEAKLGDSIRGAGTNLLNPLELEGIIRNTAGLLSTRQQLFTIILAVQSVDDVDGDGSIGADEVRAEQRAVAVVWRDPYPESGPNSRHRTFVRFFRWLTE
ncbi:MAG: hypothetical protein V1873_01465 [Verrucomicrobiota bacterium]